MIVLTVLTWIRVYGFHLHDPRLLEYVGAHKSACLLSRIPEYWIQHMGRDRAMSAALQLQHDVGLILSNLHGSRPICDVTEQDVVRSDAGVHRSRTVPDGGLQSVAPSHRVRWAAHYMAAMGLWRLPSTPGVPDPCRRHHAMQAWCVQTVSQTCWSKLFPSGGKTGNVDILPSAYISCYLPRQLIIRRLTCLMCDSLHSDDAIGSFCPYVLWCS